MLCCIGDLLSCQACAGIALLVGVYYLFRFGTADADLRTLARDVKRMDGKVAIVTGASSGIGEELSQQLSANGAYVVLMARRETELQRVQKLCAHQDKTLLITLDLCEMDSHEEKVKETLRLIKEKWGKEAIDILINNGGRSQRALIEEHMDDLRVERTLMEVNFFGTASFTKQVLKQSMIPSRGGRIAFVTSVAGKIAAPVSASYSACKHAVQGWADTLRAEVREFGITVLNIAPGPVATPIEKSTIRGHTAGEGFESSNTNEGKMPVDRAVKIMMQALSHEDIYETWVSPHPVLLFTYMFIYFPALAQALSKTAVQKRIDSYRSGKSLYSAGFLQSLKAMVFGVPASADKKDN
eukprot:TRINITY_DN44652_c0_g1_i1.p1 TRINITY_DN44652_c0_g1~~TRINITY_DN44652_c0_g1_i1.p1  ORF type:complete len:372 (+),score=174.24 TRINITY_DN44652_c0_g1_i1:52-1116(+)